MSVPSRLPLIMQIRVSSGDCTVPRDGGACTVLHGRGALVSVLTWWGSFGERFNVVVWQVCTRLSNLISNNIVIINISIYMC